MPMNDLGERMTADGMAGPYFIRESGACGYSIWYVARRLVDGTGIRIIDTYLTEQRAAEHAARLNASMQGAD